MERNWIEKLRGEFGEQVSTAAAVREQHGRDESYHETAPPDAVLFARSTEDVSRAVCICAADRVPVIPFGAGTSLEGHVAALHGGLSIDLSRMNEILEVNDGDLDATVQAGVTRMQLNRHLRDRGLFFPVDPGADATLGGMAATRASGTNAVRYGTMRDNVVALTVVLADGRVIRTSTRARKSSAGYDLTRLFVGSEGTLGVFTEITVKLQGIPETIAAAVCAFPDVGSAIDATMEIIQSGVSVARIELLDDFSMGAFVRHFGIDMKVAPTLFFEFHGGRASVEEQSRLAAEISASHGGADFNWSTDADARAKLWQARHNMHYALLALRPGAKAWGTDVCVPISRLGECLRETREDTAKASFPVSCLGHVGDGNFHLGFLIKPDDPRELAEATGLNDRLVNRALKLGGTCTGEHGVGHGKTKFLAREHGEALDVMRMIKATLDPLNILNPGKVLPPVDASEHLKLAGAAE
ncbi:FAD-binding oxidoreductase [Terrarubrum flagellatum]|uniref:FAD-binding oxidoreductase n=1 Tax=Terrirubrum flagellatum TaxID=2895980 RepID=UPI0031456A4C